MEEMLNIARQNPVQTGWMCSDSLLKSMNSRPDRNVRPTFFNDPEATGGTDISVCAFFIRLLTPIPDRVRSGFFETFFKES